MQIFQINENICFFPDHKFLLLSHTQKKKIMKINKFKGKLKVNAFSKTIGIFYTITQNCLLNLAVNTLLMSISNKAFKVS